MDIKKLVGGAVGVAVVSSMLGASKGGKKGLQVGSKLGFAAGVTSGVIGTAVLVCGKNKIEDEIKGRISARNEKKELESQLEG